MPSYLYLEEAKTDSFSLLFEILFHNKLFELDFSLVLLCKMLVEVSESLEVGYCLEASFKGLLLGDNGFLKGLLLGDLSLIP